MEFQHGSAMEYAAIGAGHRGKSGGLAFKCFFTGQIGTPENYAFSLARQMGAFYSPRHRHNFDQFRLAFRGAVNIAPKTDLVEGHVGYFPEGTHYGPQDDPEGNRETLVLQFGGASGQGYMSQEQLVDGFNYLKTQGTFEGGVFRRESGEGRKNQDGYEAVWEHVNKRPLDYPKPRYQFPILINPENFDYLDIPGQPGVGRKSLGAFTERGARGDFYTVAPGATLNLAAEPAIRLGFVLRGSGTSGAESWKVESAFRLHPGEAGTLSAKDESEIFVITLPLIQQGTSRNAAAA
jgi:hypothetical protein